MNNRGISPVIATVIIVAVAIAIAIAVAFWMTGIVGLFTGFEEVQITYAYANGSEGTNSWEGDIIVKLKNTGTSAATIDEIFINGKPYNDWEAKISPDVELPLSLAPGSEATIKLTFSDTEDGEFHSGQSVEIKIHTASGKEYPKLIVLP